MGTFLKVVGIIVIVLAFAGFIISTFSVRGILKTISYLIQGLESLDSEPYPFILNPFMNIFQVVWIVISAVIYFFIAVFGVSLFVLGSIYNNVLKINENFKSIEVVKE